jgi:hypothetical protein
MPKKQFLEAGMSFTSDSGMTMNVVEITRDAIYVELERNVRDREGRLRTEMRKREIPKHLWRNFRRPYRLA